MKELFMSPLDIHVSTFSDLNSTSTFVLVAVTLLGGILVSIPCALRIGSKYRSPFLVLLIAASPILILVGVCMPIADSLFSYSSPSTHTTGLSWSPNFQSLSSSIKSNYGYDLLTIDGINYVDSDRFPLAVNSSHSLVLQKGNDKIVTTLLVLSNATNQGQTVRVLDNHAKELPHVR